MSEYNNTYEVGSTPDDNNNTRLPGSCNPEPKRGDAEYGTYKFGKATPLDAADTAGVVGQPTLSMESTGLEGNMSISTNSNVDMKNSDTTLNPPVGDSNVNLSARYKYPNVRQDVNPLGNTSKQFNDHS